MKNVLLLLGLLATSTLSTTSFASDNIVIENEGLYPEGISYDLDRKDFYVSSVARGEVWRVNHKGQIDLFAKNNEFPSTIGIQVDADRNRLIVCVADPGVGENSEAKSIGRLAGVAIYDLTSKKELAYYNLVPPNSNGHHFANDIATDSEGNIYITDSFSPIIYKIDYQGKVNIFSSHTRWQVSEGEFGLNGIVFHPNGFLIASHYASGKLYKIDISDPEDIKEIVLNGPSKEWLISGLDGLLLSSNKSLIAVNVDPSGREKGNVVYRLISNDDWNSFEISAVMPTGNSYPTTLTNTQNGLFVLHSNLLELFSGNKSPKKTFDIERVSFTSLENQQ